MNAKELTGTAWEGSITARGLEGSIRIVFLSELSGDGALCYFHNLMDSIAIEIEKKLDEPCDFTPRKLMLNSSSAPNSAGGTLYVFRCAADQTEESKLEKIGRHPKFTVPNVKISMPDDNALEIIAPIEGVEVTYDLERIPTDTLLRVWIQSPKRRK